jgi:hypothetical protein
MQLEYAPLLPVQRKLHEIPRNLMVNGKPKRFLQYLRVMTNPDGTMIPPLVAINPMAKDHVPVVLDALLALDADRIAARTLAESSAVLAIVPGEARATLVVMDDWMGWTNRAPFEFDVRFSGGLPDRLPRWSKHHWMTAVLWSSEPAGERPVREAVLMMIHRLAYTHRHGPARTLRDKLAQEGSVMARAGCAGPVLDPENLAHTRDVLAHHLDADDMPTAVECLFGDAAADALGFTPRGLSPRAGLALALHDARANLTQGGPGRR